MVVFIIQIKWKYIHIDIVRAHRWHQIKILLSFNTLRPRQHGRHFADDTFKSIFLNENVIISIKISLKFVPDGPINNIPALVQIIAWRRLGDKPLSEPMMVLLLTHICVTRPEWVKLESYGLIRQLGFVLMCVACIYILQIRLYYFVLWNYENICTC